LKIYEKYYSHNAIHLGKILKTIKP